MGYSAKDPRTEHSATRSREDERAEEILRRAQKKEREKSSKPSEKKGLAKVFSDTATELRATTWPRGGELLRWCIIVLATVTLFAVGSMLIDNFVATPLMYWISSFEWGSETFGPLDIALVVLWAISGVGAVAGVMLHAGGDTEGLSDTLATRLTGGSGQAQKNLDRLTIAFALVFVACLVVMMIVLPQGSISVQ